VLYGADDLVEVQPRQPVHPGVGAGLADVDDGQDLVLAAREECLVQGISVIAGLRPGRRRVQRG
jgi:hypothetical protein